jgi:sporulation protein YlmC with PRC-barrel domain
MFRRMRDLEGYKVTATDGDLGSVDDFFLEDTSWTVRYLVVNTGGLVAERRVLITTVAFRAVDYSANRFRLALSMQRIKDSPSINLDLPVSRQSEREYYGHFGYPYYWGGDADSDHASSGRPGDPVSNVHLRSASELAGYRIEGADGVIGHVTDLVVDDETWKIEYMVVGTPDW